MQPLRHYCHYVGLATLLAGQDLALVLALPILERLIGSGRLDPLIESRLLVIQAERACKESV